MNNLYLAHYGVKGQKWGQRRYVDYDGTLLAAGRDRLREYNGDRTTHRQRSPKERFRIIKRSSNKTEALTKTAKPKKVDADKKARTKKLLISAGAVALTAAAAYGVHRYKKSNTNLIQIAKNTAKASVSSVFKHNSGSKKILETRKQVLYKDNANKALANLEAMKKAVDKNSAAVKKAMDAFDQLDYVVKKTQKRNK